MGAFTISANSSKHTLCHLLTTAFDYTWPADYMRPHLLIMFVCTRHSCAYAYSKSTLSLYSVVKFCNMLLEYTKSSKGCHLSTTACSCFGLVGQFTELFCMEERPCYLQMGGARMLVLAASTSIQDPLLTTNNVAKMKFHVSVVMATTHWSPCCISDLK